MIPLPGGPSTVPTMKQALAIAAGAVAGNFVAERWILKASADDPTGFILVADGFGMDDIVRAGVITAGALLAMKLLKV